MKLRRSLFGPREDEPVLLGPIEAVRVFCHDFPACLAFYRDALVLPVVTADQAFAVFDTGACKLILEQVGAQARSERALVGRFVGVSFTVADLELAYADLVRRGVMFLGRPEPQDWGGGLAHFRDPDGNVLTLVAYPDL